MRLSGVYRTVTSRFVVPLSLFFVREEDIHFECILKMATVSKGIRIVRMSQGTSLPYGILLMNLYDAYTHTAVSGNSCRGRQVELKRLR